LCHRVLVLISGIILTQCNFSYVLSATFWLAQGAPFDPLLQYKTTYSNAALTVTAPGTSARPFFAWPVGALAHFMNINVRVLPYVFVTSHCFRKWGSDAIFRRANKSILFPSRSLPLRCSLGRKAGCGAVISSIWSQVFRKFSTAPPKQAQKRSFRSLWKPYFPLLWFIPGRGRFHGIWIWVPLQASFRPECADSAVSTSGQCRTFWVVFWKGCITQNRRQRAERVLRSLSTHLGDFRFHQRCTLQAIGGQYW